ncbi:MAG TPA: aldo/keto reductase [Puia sp.]|nr:aldo/keto reductase [Puia sp.]
MAEAKGATVAQLDLAWPLHRPAITTVIIGANKPEQLADNLVLEATRADRELKHDASGN